MTQSETVRPIFIGRWTPKILFSLREQPYRHGHLRRRLGRISQRMLTRNLRQLELSGLVSRRVTQSKAIAVEYSLTQLGRTLVAPLEAMCLWAKRHHKAVMAEVHLSRPEQN
jgi:DNA-binding HxlR family transcriptional regulator